MSSGDAAGFTWIQAIPWVIATSSIVASLVFNLFNHLQTKKLRRSTIALGEFSGVRSAIEAALVEIGSGRKKLQSLASSGKSAEDLRTEFGVEWGHLVEAYSRLGDALADADQSEFASGQDWGRLPEDNWDRIVECVEVAISPESAEQENRAAANEAVALLATMRVTVRKRIETEVSKHT